jgi:hypothetical protein
MGDQKCIQNFSRKNLKGRNNRETKIIWENNIKIDLTVIGKKCVYWIELAQDKDQWQDLLDTVINLRIP